MKRRPKKNNTVTARIAVSVSYVFPFPVLVIVGRSPSSITRRHMAFKQEKNNSIPFQRVRGRAFNSGVDPFGHVVTLPFYSDLVKY